MPAVLLPGALLILLTAPARPEPSPDLPARFTTLVAAPIQAWAVEGALLVADPHGDPPRVGRVVDDRVLWEERLGRGLPRRFLARDHGGADEGYRCGWISAVMGRYPDSLWLAVSVAGRGCGSTFGTSRLFRLGDSGWAPVAVPRDWDDIPGALTAEPDWWPGGGLAFAFSNMVGDAAQGPEQVVPWLPPRAPDRLLFHARPLRVRAQPGALAWTGGQLRALGRRLADGEGEPLQLEEVGRRGGRLGAAPRVEGHPIAPPIAAGPGRLVATLQGPAGARRLAIHQKGRWALEPTPITGEIGALRLAGDELWAATLDGELWCRRASRWRRLRATGEGPTPRVKTLVRVEPGQAWFLDRRDALARARIP